MLDFLIELRFSARSLIRTPALTIALVLSIALGIASNLSVDGFVRGLLAQDQPFPPDALDSVGTLLRSAALAVFVIAGANVAAFLLARASARSRETAVRVAIGARRPQLIRQVLADSMLISIAGAIAGAVLAYWIGRIVPAMLFDEDAERMRFVSDASSVAWVVMIGVMVTIACGLLPLLETRHDDPGAIMQREAAGPSRASLRIGAGLVVVQMAACTLLVISTGLLLAGYRSAIQTSTGRRLSNAAIASVDALQMSSKSLEATAGGDYFANVERIGREMTGAREVAWVATVPGDRPVLRAFEFEPAGLPLREMTLLSEPFSTKAVEGIALPPVQGRLFQTRDRGPCGGVVVSVDAARAIGPSRVIGRSIETPSGWSEVLGVVRLLDSHRPVVFHYSPGDDETTPKEEMYRVPQVVDSAPVDLNVNIVSRNYFDMLGVRIASGKTFNDDTGACRAAIVNEEAAEQYFGGNAIGAALIDVNGLRTSVIGVVASAKLRAAQRTIEPTVYLPYGQDFVPRMTMILETDRVSSRTLRELHRRLELVRGGRPERIIVTTLDHHLSRTAYAPERIATVLVGSSAAIALVLGTLGVYGVMSDAARRRRRELALRIALGAQRRRIIQQVVVEGMRLVIAGTSLGIAGSLMVARSIARISPVIDTPSAAVWLAAPIALLVVVALASVLPARKALASDPLSIMRSE